MLKKEKKKIHWPKRKTKRKRKKNENKINKLCDREEILFI